MLVNSDKMRSVFYLKLIVTYIFIILLTACNMDLKQNPKYGYISDIEAIATLRQNMENEKEWIKVHAAEFLLWSGYPEEVKETFLNEEQLYGNISPYRIGIWRVLAQAETEQQEKEVWIDKIKRAFWDEDGSDRIHAIETLAKLKVPIFHKEIRIEDIVINNTLDNFSIYKLWNFAYTSDDNFLIAQDTLLKLSIATGQDSTIRIIAVYVLKKMGKLDDAAWNLLTNSALEECENISIQTNLLSAAIVTAPNEIAQTEIFKRLMDKLIFLDEKENSNILKMSLLDTLAEKGDDEYLGKLYAIFDEMKSEDMDGLSTCAYAILKINGRNK